MKTTSIFAIVLVVVIGGISVYAILPYFTNSTVDETIPEGTIAKPSMDETMMDETMMMTQYYEGSFVGVNMMKIHLDNSHKVLRLCH